MNRGRFDDRQDNRRERDNAPRFNYNDNRRDFRDAPPRGDRFERQRPENKRDFNDRDMDRPRNEPQQQRQRDRNEHDRNRNERDNARDKRSPNRSSDRGGVGSERPRSPVRSNPFRRNKNPDEPSDFRYVIASIE